MTEKRFTLTFDDNIVDNLTGTTHDVHSGYDVAMDLSDLLNNLHEENKELQKKYNAQKRLFGQLNSDSNNLFKENEQLKKRNKNQYKQLQHLWSLMEAKDWETLSEMVNQMEEDEKRLQNEWKCYE